jgi:hypothetical protein
MSSTVPQDRFPNVVAWVNGHTHVNRVNPVPDPTGYTGGFWEITTAAHVDYPEHARIIELVDNRDGTLSIFGTVIAPQNLLIIAMSIAFMLGLLALFSATDVGRQMRATAENLMGARLVGVNVGRVTSRRSAIIERTSSSHFPPGGAAVRRRCG